MSRASSRRQKDLSATTLRYILVACLFLIIAAMAAGFYFVHGQLQVFAKDVADTQAEAKTSDAKLNNLMQLEKQLKKHEATVKKSEQIVAESQSYMYQNQVIEDLTTYASRTGISIMSFSFQSAENATGGTDATTAPPAIDNSSATTDTKPSETQQSSPSVRNTIVSIRIASPVRYVNLLHFMHLIEENLTRMQITEFSLSGGDSADFVSTDSFNIEVYIR